MLRIIERPVEGQDALRNIEGHQESVNAMAVLADGRQALSASNDTSLKLWDLERGAVLRTLGIATDDVWPFGGNEGRYAMSGPPNGRHQDWVAAVAVLADGRRALSASEDCTLKLWDLESGTGLRTLEGHQGLVTAVAAQADGCRALSASYDETLKLWDLKSGNVLATFIADAVITAVAVAQTRRFVAGSRDGSFHILQLLERNGFDG